MAQANQVFSLPSRLLVSACLLLLLSHCAQESNPIIGNWVASEVKEQGERMQLDPSEIRFSFSEDGRYQYQSTLLYREAGSYRIQDDYLLAQDTTHAASKQRVVVIELLKQDSLALRMKEGERERSILLLRP